ncbi:MAG: helix-turn-helix transcriptional regulator [Lentisphaeria bacterium]|jgi:AraC-like DNA-binding protein
MPDTYALALNPPPDPRPVMRQLLAEQMERLRTRNETLRLPPSAGTGRLERGMHMHLEPELFLQIGGRTEFHCPGGGFALDAGEICLMPRATAHGERALAADGRAFLNAVLLLQAGHASLHFARATERRQPYIFAGPLRLPMADPAPPLAALLDEAAVQQRRGDADSLEACRALLRAALAIVHQRLGEPDAGAAPHRPGRIVQCQALVHAQLGDAALSVRRLAAALQCSADYLSHQFHGATGMRLAEYINRKRIAQAQRLLAATGLTIAEVAWACGYQEPAYFARQFRRLTGHTPRAWRGRPDGGGQGDPAPTVSKP